MALQKPRNVKRISVTGAKQIQANLREIIGAISGDEWNALAQAINAVVGEAAEEIADQARANARAQGLDQTVVDSIFTYNKPAARAAGGAYGRKRNTALVGVARGYGYPSYTEWRTNKGPGQTKSKDGKRVIVRKVGKGNLVGMSAAAMAEFGTSNKMPKPFFYPAVRSTRAKLRAKLGIGIRDAIQQHAPKIIPQAA